MSGYPPLLLIHGAWHGKWCYETFFVDYLTQAGFEVMAIDLPGHGEQYQGTSDLRWRSFQTYVDAVAEAAKRFDQPPIVIGHSMGGAVVQKYLDTHAAPAGVLLASIPPGGVFGVALGLLRNHFGPFIRSNLTFSLYPLIETPELARAHFFSESMPAADVARYQAQMHDESFRAFLELLAFDSSIPSRIQVPMLVLGGEKDTIFPPSVVDATAKAYGSEAIIFPGMAHDMMLEPEWQKVADRIIDWVQSELSPSA